MRRHRITAGIILGVITISAPALALKPGETLKFQYSAAWIEPIDPSTPAVLLATGKVVPHPMAMSMSFTVSADRLEEDGAVHVIIQPHMMSLVRGWSLNEPFEGSVLADGEIVPKYDLAMIKASGIDQTSMTVSRGYHPRTHEESSNFSAFSFTRQLALYNDLALGAGKKNSFKDGETWRVSIADKDEIVDFTYQGMQSYHGHEVAAIGFTTTRVTQKGVAPVTGNVLYDLNRHMVTSAHAVGDDDSPLGVRNMTVDITLQ